MKNFKVINISLIVLSTIVLLEASLNLFGRIALINEDFNKAKTFLSLIREKELLGLVYYKQDQFEKAYNYYKQRKDWRGMGWAYYGMGKYDEAQDYFKRVNDSAGLGQVKLAQKNYTEAKQIFEETKEYSGIGLTYLADNNHYDAKKAFLGAGDNFGLGITYFAKGDYNSSKKVFSQSKNKTVQGLKFLMNNNYEEALNSFESMNDNNILGGFYKFLGNYQKSLDYYTKTNNKKISQILMEMGEYEEAFRYLNVNDDKNALADLYYNLGDYEKAHEYYNQAKNFQMAYLALNNSGNTQQALNYAEKIIKVNNDVQLKLSLIENLRLNENFKLCENEIIGIKNDLKIKPEVLILLSRLNLSRGSMQSLQSDLQDAVNVSGNGSLTREILNAAEMIGLNITPPQEEVVGIISRSSPFKLLKIFIAGFLILAISGITAWVMHIKKKERSELHNLEISRRTRLSKTHKAIYSGGKPSINLETVRKLQPKTVVEPIDAKVEKEDVKIETDVLNESDIKKSDTDPLTKVSKIEQEKDVKPVADAQSKLEKSGVQILQIALKKLGITSSAFELLELAGEEEGKLTVYGIYLAARSKGAQVQGIKVEINYLNENKNNIILVFFRDETFALLSDINDNAVELVHGISNIQKISISEFKELWNGYIISISKT